MTNDEDIIRPHLPRPYGYGLSDEQIRENEEIEKRAKEASEARDAACQQQHEARTARLNSPDPPADGARSGRTWASLND